MRTSPIHYIAPSAISIIPNANGSSEDLSVYVARGTRIKVYSPKAGIDMVENAYQEWTISGRNRRLGDITKPYTIYVRLNKEDNVDGYIVFTPKRWDNGEWKDGHPYVTINGIEYWEQYFGYTSYYYIRLGDVSLPVKGERTTMIDTGILGTDQFNTEWALNPDALPLRVEIGCTINDEDTGPTPYICWGQSLVLTANLVEGWTGTKSLQFDHWEIRRNTGDPYADTSEVWPANEIADVFSKSGSIGLRHIRGAYDDFNGAVAATFVVSAWGKKETDSDTSDESGLSDNNTEYILLKSSAITILAETVEKYELALSTFVVSYSPQMDEYTPVEGVVVRIRAIDQRGDTFEITRGHFRNANLAIQYATVDSDNWNILEFTGAETSIAEATIDISTFHEQKSLNVRIVRTVETGNQSSDFMELSCTTISFVRYGESITKKNETYRYATNKTGVRPDAGDATAWDENKPALQQGWWLFTETTITWSDDSTTVLYTDERNPNDGVPGQDIIVDGPTEMKYYEGTSNTTHPTEDSTEWKELSAWPMTQGKWLWSKATTYYRKANSTAGAHDAGSSVNYNVSYISKDGLTGRGIKTTTELYQATDSSASRQKPTSDSGWSTDPNVPDASGNTQWNESKKYLWNCEKTVYANSDGTESTEYTVPRVLAIWTKDGAAGKGIDSITNYYKVSNLDGTTPDKSEKRTDQGGTGWDDNPVAPTEEQPFLWNYERITWLNYGSGQQYTYTEPHIIGRYGKDAHEVNPNILLRTIFDEEKGIEYVKEAWSSGRWDRISFDHSIDTHAIQGRQTVRLTPDNSMDFGLYQSILGKIKPDTWYTFSFYSFCGGGHTLFINNSVDGNRVNIFGDDVIVDGRTVTITNDNNDIGFGTSWDGLRHTVTFKTNSNISNSKLDIGFYCAYNTNYSGQQALVLCMPKLEEGKHATAYVANEDDLKGDKGDDTFSVTSTPPVVSFACDFSGIGIDTNDQIVSLKMFKGTKEVLFTGTINNQSNCTARIVDTNLYINTYKNNLSNGGSVAVSLTNSTYDVSRSLLVSVIGSKQGVPGSAGPMLYPAGRWVDKVYMAPFWYEKRYIANGDSRPYVLYEGDGKYYYLNVNDGEYAKSDDVPGTSDKWALMTQVDVVFAKFGIMDYGKMASAVFCGDWMYSQYGKLFTSTTDYYTVNQTAQSDNTAHWKYDHAYTAGGTSAAPFAWFNPDYPQGGAANTFAPNWAVNLLTGTMYGAKGNFVLKENGDVELRGTVYATDGEFKGTVYANGGEFNGVIKAQSLYLVWQSPYPTYDMNTIYIDLSLGTGILLQANTVSLTNYVYYLPDRKAGIQVTITLGCFVGETTRSYSGPPVVRTSGEDVIIVQTSQGTISQGLAYTVKGIRVPINRIFKLYATPFGWAYEGDETGVMFYTS